MTPHEPEQSSRSTGTSVAQRAAGPERAQVPGGRRQLDRPLILREAVRFIDAHGRDRLTMRRLGAELGVEAMALYRYVPGRDQLLDGVVETLMDELYGLTMELERPGTWQEFLEQAAHAVRSVALQHPRIFPLVATRPSAAPWLRPPLRSLRWVEAFLQGLRAYGLSRQQSVLVYRAFATFLLGHLLLESASCVVDLADDPADGAGLEPADDLTAYPLLAELSPELAHDAFDDEFVGSLGELIDRIVVDAR